MPFQLDRLSTLVDAHRIFYAPLLDQVHHPLCMRRCSVQSTPAPSIAHRHPRWPLDDQRRTDSTGRYRTRTSNTALLSPAKLVPTDPGPRPSRRGHRLGRVSGQLSPTHRRRARTSRPRQRQPTTWMNGRWCAVMATGPRNLQPDPRSPLDPRLRDGSTPPQPALGQPGTNWQRTGTTLHDSPGVGLCQLRKRSRRMGRMGFATESFDLREGFAGILRSSLAQLACDVVASRMNRGRVH